MTTIIPRISQLSKNIWRILGCNPSPYHLQGNNVYLVGQGEKRILIDAGPKGFQEYVENLRKVLKQQNAIVEHLILTHWHYDHTGGLEEIIAVFKDVCGVLPRVHKFPRLECQDEPIPSEYEFEELQDGQMFHLDGVSLKIIYTPGHTTDHACLHFLEENVLFCGDALLGEGTGLFEDLYDYLQSLYLMKRLKPSKILSAHGPVINDVLERLDFNINHQLIREKKVYNLLVEAAPQGITQTELVGQMYRVLSANLRCIALRNVQNHLTKLLRENKIQEKQGRYYINKFSVEL